MTDSYAPLLRRSLAAFEADPTSRSREHLAGYSFRFDPDVPTPAVPRPVEGETWSLSQTLQELRLRDLEVVQTTRGLRVRHGWRMADLVEAVAQHERAVTVWLRIGSPAPLEGWDDATALHLAWLETAGLSESLELRPGVTITDWDLFVSSTRGRYHAGAHLTGADSLRRDLEALFERYALAPRLVVSPRRRARAA